VARLGERSERVLRKADGGHGIPSSSASTTTHRHDPLPLSDGDPGQWPVSTRASVLGWRAGYRCGISESDRRANHAAKPRIPIVNDYLPPGASRADRRD